MNRPSIRKNRFKKNDFNETLWTKKSRNLGEYIFRRLSIDQSDQNLQNIRPRHCLSKLIVSSVEIERYISDYIVMLAKESNEYNVPAIRPSGEKSPLNNYFASDLIGNS